MIDSATRIAGRYRVDARLGGGGMADVYEAHDEVLDRPVALKLLRGIDDAAAARRFAEEIRLTARVNHPNIVALYDAGEHDASPFLVLERVTGGTLAGEMADGPMDPRRVATIGEQLASALSHSHAAGIVHRDVKPTNILLTGEGSVRLADFGIAVTATRTRLTVTGTIAGSAGYVSPEQVLGSGAGAASDVYALGLVLLECLTGAPPWSGTTVEVALARITADPPMPADLPAPWRALLRAMTTRDPEQRADINLVGYALSRLAVGETYDPRYFAPVSTTDDRRVPAVAGMTLAVLLVSAFVTLTSQSTPQLAAAASSAPAPVHVNVSGADALLQPAVLPSPAPALADRAARQRKVVDERTAKPRPARSATTPPQDQAAPPAPATASAPTSDDSVTRAPSVGVTDALPRVRVPARTAVDVPETGDVDDKVTDPAPPKGSGADRRDENGKGTGRRAATSAVADDRRTQRTIDQVIESLTKSRK